MVAVVLDSVPFVTDRVTLISNGAPSATLTTIVAGPAAVKSVLSVRSSASVKVKGAPVLFRNSNRVKPVRPENRVAGRVVKLLLFSVSLFTVDKLENIVRGSVLN